MIRLVRPVPPPAQFTKMGSKQTKADCDAYDACPDDFLTGQSRFPKREYYSASRVKDVLVAMHHSKCCYCEKKLLSRGYLHVEHFRPKSAVRQLAEDRDELPGYYWLAYQWDNLLLSCLDCNSRSKHTLFPLADPAVRAHCHLDDITREQPLFIDPATDDPRLHIRFDDDVPMSQTEKGRTTIAGISLRRAELREERLKLLRHIDARNDIIEVARRHPEDAALQLKADEARQFIEEATRPDAEFSSMVIDYCEKLGIGPKP